MRHARQQRTIETPFFAGHLFVALDLEKQEWRPIERMAGILGLFLIGDRPAPAPEGLVDALMEAVGFNGPQEPTEPIAANRANGVASAQSGKRLGLMNDLCRADRVRVLLAIMTGEIVVGGGRREASGGE